MLQLKRAVEVLVALMLTAMMTLTVLDVIGRYFLSAPFPGAYELTRVSMGLLVFSALPIVSARESHISVELFIHSFLNTERRTAVHRCMVNLASMLIMGFVSWQVWKQGENMMRNGDKTPSLSLPLYPFVFYMAVLGCVTTIILAAVWYSYVRSGRNVFVRLGTASDVV